MTYEEFKEKLDSMTGCDDCPYPESTGLVNISIEDMDTNEVILDCDRPDWANNEAEKTSDV